MMRDLFAFALGTVLGASIGLAVILAVVRFAPDLLAPPLYAAPPHPIRHVTVQWH